MNSRILTLLFLLLTISAMSQAPRMVLPSAHHGFIEDICFSPDGKYILTGSYDRTAKLWDVRTGNLLFDIQAHNEGVNSVSFSSDGKYMATAGDDARVLIYELPGCKLKTELKGEILGFNNAEFSPDGKYVLAAVGHGGLTIWELEGQKRKWELKSEEGSTYGSPFFAHYSPDGSKIFSNTGDSTIAIWDATTFKLIRKLEKKKNYGFNYAQVSTDGKRIVRWNLFNYTADITDLETGNYLSTLNGYNWYINAAHFLKEGQTVITSGGNSKVTQWEISTGIIRWERAGSIRDIAAEVEHLLVRHNGEFEIVDALSGKTLQWISSADIDMEDIQVARFDKHGERIAFVYKDHSIRIFDVARNRVISTLEGHSVNLGGVSLSDSGRDILISGDAGYQKIWDNDQLKFRLVIRRDPNKFKYPVYSPDNSCFITKDDGYEQGIITIWNAQDGKPLAELPSFAGYSFFSPDNQVIATLISRGQEICFWDRKTFQLLSRYDNGYIKITGMKFSPKGNMAALVCWDSTILLVDRQTAAVVHILKEEEGGEGIDIAFSPDGKYLLTMCSYKNRAIVWDIASGKKIKTLNDPDDFFYGTVFSEDGSKLISFTHHNDIAKIWDFRTGKLIKALPGHTSRVLDGGFFPGGRKMYTTDNTTLKTWDAEKGELLASYDLGMHTSFGDISFRRGSILATANPEIKLFSLDTGKPLYTLVCIDSLDYLCLTPAGYFKTTPGAAKMLHYVTRDLKVITFEQLDVKYNRPDKVLETAGSKDSLLIKSYRKAWEKRIKKLGVDTSRFREGYSVPEADFINRDDIEPEQSTGKLTLHLRGTDTAFILDRFNIWVNETPLYGQRGIRIGRRLKNDFDTIITISLSQGQNKIETSVTNVNGTESYRMPLTVTYSPQQKEKESVHFIGIGIDRFADSGYNLQYSRKDIRDLAKRLKEKYGDDINIDTLFNEQATTHNVKALKQQLLKTGVNDKVIVSYSGHGMLSKDFDYFLSTYDVDFENPEANGLAYDELESLLDSIPARKKLMLIDACHSGEVDKDDLTRIDQMSDSMTLKKGLKPVSYKKDAQIGLQNSFELMQSVFVNVGKSTGATIISAAAGTQFALERNDLENGVFTFAILEALKNHSTLKISELKRIVGERVEQLTNGLQKPTSRNETIAVDWDIW